MNANLDVVTGAFGFTGRYIARRLLASGRRVTTLTRRPERNDEFGDLVKAIPYHFDNPRALVDSLRGVDTLYSTYWVRFEYGLTTFAKVVADATTLFECAEKAGVRRVVHTSVSNPSLDLPLPYFQGKARLEEALKETVSSYVILRPTLIFGVEDILINNIAYLLRRFPFFAVPGSGEYRVQPVYAGDVAEIAARVGEASENMVVDVAGPEIFTFNQLVRILAEGIGSRVKIVNVNPWVALKLSNLVGLIVDDVILTRDEMDGLMRDLLISADPPAGHTSFSAWVADHASLLGMQYASEMERHFGSIP